MYKNFSMELIFGCIGACLTAFLFVIFIGKFYIKLLKKVQASQVIRDDGPATHSSKKGTPTTGGILLIFSIIISSLIWSKSFDIHYLLSIFTLLSFGIIGVIDDIKKILRKSSNGLSAKQKYLAQTIASIFIILCLNKYTNTFELDFIQIPILGRCHYPHPFLPLLLAYFVIVGSSNASNLTDGLDGLAASIIANISIGMIILWMSNHIFHTESMQNVLLLLFAVVGSCLGFLRFNIFPAKIFMGDVGSLSLGAFLGLFAVIFKQEMALFFMATIMVVETVSVIMQVLYYKKYKKRIFKMAPLHHHFELNGWSEKKIVLIFNLITMLMITVYILWLK